MHNDKLSHATLLAPGLLRTLLLAVVVLLAGFTGTYRALADRVSMPGGSYYTVWGQSARLYDQATVSFTGYASWMDVWENSGSVYVTNGTAACSRSRIFDPSWTLIASYQSSGTPYPMVAPAGWSFDSYLFSTVTAGYPMRGYHQVSSDYVGGQCAYGGGVGWEKSGQFIAWSHWATST